MGHVVSKDEVKATLVRCRSIAGKLRPGDADHGEKLLTQLQQYLHTNHAICTEVKTSLVSSCALVKNKTGNMFDRQLELAEQVLKVLDVIDPGMTPRRGGILKHVIEIKMKRANLQVEEGDIDRKAHMEIMRSSMVMMREAIKCCSMG